MVWRVTDHTLIVCVADVRSPHTTSISGTTTRLMMQSVSQSVSGERRETASSGRAQAWRHYAGASWTRRLDRGRGDREPVAMPITVSAGPLQWERATVDRTVTERLNPHCVCLCWSIRQTSAECFYGINKPVTYVEFKCGFSSFRLCTKSTCC